MSALAWCRLDPLRQHFPASCCTEQSRTLVQDIALECSVSAMPTFQVWKNGQKVDELVGASKEKLRAMVEKHSAA